MSQIEQALRGLMTTVRWGMIGAGDVAEVKSGPAFRKADNSTLVAVMRRNGALAKDYARRHEVERWSDDAADVIDADDIDAVYIATPTSSHREYTLRCAAAGKAVYVEKPMAMTYEECEDMISACGNAGVPLWVAYYRRALPRFLAVRDLITDGAVGPVRAVRSERLERLITPRADGELPWRLRPEFTSGGVFVDGVCHTLDFLDLLFGPVEEVHGLATNQGGAYQVEDTVTATFRYRSGVYGSGLWCFAADVDLDETVVIGATGRLTFSTMRADPIRLIRGGTVEEIPVGDPPHVHQPLVQTIVDELNGDGTCPSTGASGARTSWVMDQILAEFRERHLS